MIDVRRYEAVSSERSYEGFLVIKNGRGFFISSDEAKELLTKLLSLLKEDGFVP
ncbi:MAG: hypothetical protein QXP84_07325 [Candidatus Korarchaeum sp.]